MKHVIALSLTTLLASTGLATAQDSGLSTAQSAQANPAGGFVVYFALDKSTLNAEARSVIAQAAQEFQRSGSARISVRGHTDTSGSSGYNQALSERREQAVANELMALGVPQAAITGEALGETDPAVPTGDGVPEAGNRRVDIAIEQPPAPVAEMAPAPTPAPVTEPAPQPVREKQMPKWIFSVGPYYGYNLEDEAGHDSQLGGLNFAVDVPVTPWLSAGVEQAGFYHFDTPNDGFGGRSVASLDFTFGDDAFRGHAGGNFGYLYGSGFDDDFVAGPEVGFAAGRFIGKLAYDIPFNRDLDEGIINTTFGVRF
ncbi:OmpA family protein [Dongia rigui]|uniref:OmpA family protein n=1 Tax=Dongia rigui TaxID=940149 RepID=A0ABU5DUS2_9PROT|nr:OmpA family protein [Dongia rigui]MDY0870438.1 OmpA family protein [Dongia rigui]